MSTENLSDAPSILHVEPDYRCPACGCSATKFEDEEIQCDSRACGTRPTTRYGKFVESDFTLWQRLKKESDHE